MGLLKKNEDKDTQMLRKAVEKTQTAQHFKQKAKEGKSDVPQSVWDKKDRSKLVGGRSHDAVELVKAALMTQTPIDDVLKIYKDTLSKILKIADEVK